MTLYKSLKRWDVLLSKGTEPLKAVVTDVVNDWIYITLWWTSIESPNRLFISTEIANFHIENGLVESKEMKLTFDKEKFTPNIFKDWDERAKWDKQYVYEESMPVKVFDLEDWQYYVQWKWTHTVYDLQRKFSPTIKKSIPIDTIEKLQLRGIEVLFI